MSLKKKYAFYILFTIQLKFYALLYRYIHKNIYINGMTINFPLLLLLYMLYTIYNNK